MHPCDKPSQTASDICHIVLSLVLHTPFQCLLHFANIWIQERCTKWPDKYVSSGEKRAAGDVERVVGHNKQERVSLCRHYAFSIGHIFMLDSGHSSSGNASFLQRFQRLTSEHSSKCDCSTTNRGSGSLNRTCKLRGVNGWRMRYPHPGIVYSVHDDLSQGESDHSKNKDDVWLPGIPYEEPLDPQISVGDTV